MNLNIEDRNAALAQLIRLCEPYIEPAIAAEGAKQSVAVKVVGTIESNGVGNATATVTADAMANSPKAISVAVANNDSAATVAGKIRAALSTDDDVSEFFDISGTGIKIILTVKEYDANDVSMALTISDGTCTGLTLANSIVSNVGSLPDLSEVEAILDDNLIAATWQPNAVYAVGQHVYPTNRNGHKYVVTVEGTSGATEPESWPTMPPYLEFTDGTAKLREDGVEFIIGYDIQQAALECWRKKMARASEMVSTPGIDQAKIFDRCSAMADQYEPLCIG